MTAFYTPAQTHVLLVISSTIPTLVVLATSLRLYLKGRHKWGWDDLLATIGVLAMIEQVVVFWTLAVKTAPIRPVFYAIILSQHAQIWLARSSILASIVRIVPVGTVMRRVSLAMTGAFAIMWLVQAVQFLWVCETHLPPPNVPIVVCASNEPQIPIYQITAATVADTILILLPLQILRAMRRHSGLRRRLQFTFAASALTSVASVIHAVYNINRASFGLLIAAETECWVSLLVCNFSVLFTAAFKAIGKESIDDIPELIIP